MKRLGIGLVVLLFTVLLGGPLVAPVMRNEARLWRLAALQNAFAAGEPQALQETLQLVQPETGFDRRAARVAVEMLLANQQPREAARLSQVLIEQTNPDRLTIDRPLGQLQLHVLEANRQFAAAVRWVESHTRSDQPPSETDLNRLAYLRALAGKNLPLALDEIQLAIATTNRQALLGTPARLEAVAVIAAALLAREPLEQAELRDALTAEIELHELNDAVTSESPQPNTASGPRDLEELQLLYTARAKLLERIGATADSQQDRTRVQALGGDPSELLQRIPRDEVLMVLAQFAAALLDTRGYILFRIDQTVPTLGGENLEEFLRFGSGQRPVRSLGDFDAAVLAARTFYRHLVDFPTLNAAPFVSRQTFADELAQARETLATLYSHRAAAKEVAGDTTGAGQDRRQITELGLDPQKKYF